MCALVTGVQTCSLPIFHVTPIDAPRGVRFDVLERITAAAFGQRRKMLRQSLKGVPGALAALDALGIDSTRRAETVSVDEFITLARALDRKSTRLNSSH